MAAVAASIGTRLTGRNEVVLVCFTAITNLADGVIKVVLPLLATRITSSPGLIAGVGVAVTLPWLFVALHAGVLVDRFDRRRLLWIADGTRIISILGLLISVLTQTLTIGVLYVAGLILGVASVVALTATAAVIPSAIAKSDRERANARIVGAETVGSEFAGPFLGGLLAAAGMVLALGVTGVAYTIATGLLVLLVGVFRPISVADVAHGVNHQITEGLTFLWRQPVLRLMALVLTVLCACWGVWLSVIPALAVTQWGYSPQAYGSVLSALGIGGLVGAVTVRRINRLFTMKAALLADLIGTFIMMVIPVLSSMTFLVAFGAFIGGMGGTLWNINARTISQSLVPNELLGRYNAAARLFSWGAIPVGGLLGATLTQWIGAGFAFALCAVATAITTVIFLWMIRCYHLEPQSFQEK